MKPEIFRQPVIILVGLGFPTQVRMVMDAYRHLVEWPTSSRDTAHSIALKVCGGAFAAKSKRRPHAVYSQPLPKNMTCLHRTPTPPLRRTYEATGIRM